MFKRIIIYFFLAILIFMGADKALTQSTETVAIILNIEVKPASLTGDWHDAVYTVAWDLPGNTLTEDGGSLSRAITVDPGEHASVTLVHSFSAPSPAISHSPQPSGMKTTPDGFLDNYNSMPRLAIDETSSPIVITQTETTMWNLHFWYAETMTTPQYNQILTWELTVN